MLKLRALGCRVVAVEPKAWRNRLVLASLRANSWANAGVQLHSAGAGLRRWALKERRRSIRGGSTWH